eukprot:11164778-Lingulodinium_polyedra.AAC.1
MGIVSKSGTPCAKHHVFPQTTKTNLRDKGDEGGGAGPRGARSRHLGLFRNRTARWPFSIWKSLVFGNTVFSAFKNTRETTGFPKPQPPILGKHK